MSFRQPYQDPQSERLLLVVLEEREFAHGSDYRHIRATVIRRAVPHKMREDGSAVETYNDDTEAKCKGYRVASYVFGKNGANPMYVDDMQLRGQIDAMPNPMQDGKPYGNEVRFTPYQVDQNTARAINDTYTRYGKFLAKEEDNRYDMEFAEKLNQLAKFLKITKFVFYKEGVRHTSLDEVSNFLEGDILFASKQIDRMLAPFRKETNN